MRTRQAGSPKTSSSSPSIMGLLHQFSLLVCFQLAAVSVEAGLRGPASDSKRNIVTERRKIVSDARPLFPDQRNYYVQSRPRTSNIWDCLILQDENGCNKAASCTWCNSQVGMGFCLSSTAAKAASKSSFFDCDTMTTRWVQDI